MANYYSLGLVAAMDRLWFHQIILFSEPIISGQKNPQTTKPNSVSLAYSPLPDEEISSAISLLPDEEISSDSSPISPTNDSNNEDEEKEISQKESRPTRLNLIRSRNRPHSSSPTTQKRSKNLGNSAMRRLHKSMSCKSLGDLEIEEVKGFMDLGFIFKKEHLSPRMMSVVPGLQRLVHKNKQSTKLTVKDNETGESKGESGGVKRPYLSEAWLIKRPNSPLLNLRMPSASTADDMKKHIRFWARTVASAIQQES
ncbi:hypothetical protein FCV25MIE_09959 [Fagus crenata]